MENVSHMMKRHKRVTKTNEKPMAPCNCRDKSNCPVNENYRVENVAYNCVVSVAEKSKEHFYVGVAEGHWKQPY